MHDSQRAHTSLGSTTWEWRKVKIRKPPQAPSTTAGRRPSLAGLRRRDPRKPLTIVIRYRGGSEAWWQLKARGVTINRPGHLTLDEVLSEYTGTRE